MLLALVLLLVLAWVLIHYTPVQNWLVKKVASRLSKNLGTEVTVKHVDFDLLNKMQIQGTLVRDKQKDTLLYAGAINVNITDWFFFEEKATLYYVGLEDAVINLKRSTSPEWNYQFLVDYFSSPKAKKDTTAKKDGIQFDLKKVKLKNVRFNQLDQWVGKDLVGSIKEMELNAEEMDFANKKITIKDITLTEPLFAQRNYAGKRPSSTTTTTTSATPVTVPTAYQAQENGWALKVNTIKLVNGHFINNKETDRLPFTDRFDGQHLDFANINATLKNVQFSRDTLSTDITLATKEKSGLNIKKLQANMKFTSTIMEFNNLDLQVNNSRLGNYYAMNYNSFNTDMANFLHNVVLEGRFINSELYSDDLAIFAPALKSWKRVFNISGNARGSIDNLSAKGMLIKSGNTIIDGDITMRGLPDIQQTFIDYKGNTLQTNYTDLVTLMPSLKNLRQPQLQRLGTIVYKGNFTGFINDFVAYGNFNTALGRLDADINMKVPSGKPAIYSGKVATDGFKLGQFLNNSQLGNIAFDGKIKGAGFTAQSLKANFDGHFKRFDFNGYPYQNLSIIGDFENKLFQGKASINDPNLEIDSLVGSINLNGKEPDFNFDAQLRKALLRPLGITKDDFAVTGKFKLNFTGSNIDNFLGSAKILNASLTHDSKRLSFDSLALSSLYDNGIKTLRLQSNEANAEINGRFKILQLPDAFKLLLNKYYPAYIKPPVKAVTDQEFDFSIKTGNVDEYIQLIDKKLQGFNNADISGSLRLGSNELTVNAKVPQMSYDGKSFTGINLQTKGTADTLTGSILVDDVAINDSLHFPGTKLLLKSHNDISQISLTTSASKTLNSAELYASVQTLPDGAKIHFFPSSFIINDKKWALEKDGELILNKNYLAANEIKFVQGQQEIAISTEPDEVRDNVYNIVAKLTKVHVDDFAPFIVKKPRLEGILDGELTISDPFGKPEISLRRTTIKDLRVDNNLLGNLELESGDYNFARGLVNYKGKTTGENMIEFEGSYDTKDSTNNQIKNILRAKQINLAILQPYLGSIFSDMKGIATGDINIYGGKQGQYATGTLQITNGSLKVNYTQCKYNFTNETIILNENAINFGEMELKDTLNNTATLSGTLYHQFFTNFSFDDIRFHTNRMLLLNTAKKDNAQFYGKVIGNATLTLDGPANNMRMNIEGGPSSNESDSNHIYLPGGNSREAGSLDYLDFVQFGSLMESELKTKEGTTILVDMKLNANPACKVDVILDEVTGDIIKGEGYGQLAIRVGNKEPLSIRGRYDISKGSYDFNYQTFIKKPFTLKSGFINWTGDPYEAEIKIDAEYKATTVNLGNILPNSKQQSDISIIAHLTETLKKPAISFELMIPPGEDFADKLIVQKKLDDYRRDPTEMNKQVSSLLIFGSFINTDQGILGGSNPYNFAVGTIGQVLSSFLTNSFSRFLQKTLNDPNITTYFDISPSLNSVRQLQAAAKFGLVKTYLNNRLIISLGGNLDYNNPYLLQGTNNLLITPDFAAEWLITRDGKLRVVGFRRTSIDQVLGQRNRQGLSLTYKREFD